MSYWKGPVFQVIKAMQKTGNQTGLVERWARDAIAWANANTGPDARAIREWAPLWRNRPFYTAAELSHLFPVLAISLRISKTCPEAISPARLENELRFGGLPVIQNAAGGEHFNVNGNLVRLFAVERLHHWKKVRLTQSEAEKML